MTEIIDTSEHWDALAARIAAEAGGARGAAGFAWFAQSRAGWVVASLLLVAGLAFLALPAEDSSPAGAAEWVEALAPADEAGMAMVLRDGPPPLGALLLAGRIGGRR